MTVSVGSDLSDRGISERAGCIKITKSAIKLITPINFILNRDILGLLKMFKLSARDACTETTIPRYLNDRKFSMSKGNMQM
jgi:hypothetical protein